MAVPAGELRAKLESPRRWFGFAVGKQSLKPRWPAVARRRRQLVRVDRPPPSMKVCHALGARDFNLFHWLLPLELGRLLACLFVCLSIHLSSLLESPPSRIRAPCEIFQPAARMCQSFKFVRIRIGRLGTPDGRNQSSCSIDFGLLQIVMATSWRAGWRRGILAGPRWKQ